MPTSPAVSIRIQPSGPVDARILVVGEAAGKTEEQLGVPFVGASGQELRRMLDQAGIDPKSVRFTNVFMTRPSDNKIESYCGKKDEVGGKDYTLPPLSMGKYFRPEYLFELVRLASEIEALRPTLVIALGNTACWALMQQTGIGKLRGSKFEVTLAGVSPGIPVIPTYHPVAVIRQWDLRVVAVQDFIKCERFVREGFSLPRRELLLAPTLRECFDWVNQHIKQPWAAGTLSRPLSLDIETKRETITCIGFSPHPAHAICIPFHDPAQADGNYWRSDLEEIQAYLLCKQILESEIPKLGQNLLYDIQYLFRYGIKVNHAVHDTMIRHHALYPELEKGLGFMGSIYTDEAPWKLLRNRNRDNHSNKIDDE